MQQQQQPYEAAAAMQHPYAAMQQPYAAAAAMQQPYAAPAAASGTEGDTCGIWEIPVRNIKMKLNRMGVPQEVLGEGSFGVVGLGSYTGSTQDGSVVNIPVAIKTVLCNVLSAAKKDPAVLRSFLREVKFMCTLDHPNICDCHGAVTRQEGDLLMWIVMEKLDMNLHTAIMGGHVQHGRVAPGPFVEMLAGLLGALAYLHTDQQNPMVHRDLKPENVMLTSDNPPVMKLIDFGLSKETRYGVGSTFNKKGTPEWMAPEQKRDGGCTTASDVYAIGLVAQFMWSGRRPSDAQAPAHLVLTSEQTPHQLAAVTLSLMSKCLNPVRLSHLNQ
jgi:serine/threonine protein kinase